MDAFPTNYIQVHILCVARNSVNEELEAQIKQFRELALPTEKFEAQLKPIEHEWRVGRIMLCNVETYYPDATGTHTIIQTVSGSALTIKEPYEDVKQLADVYTC